MAYEISMKRFLACCSSGRSRAPSAGLGARGPVGRPPSCLANQTKVERNVVHIQNCCSKNRKFSPMSDDPLPWGQLTTDRIYCISAARKELERTTLECQRVCHLT